MWTVRHVQVFQQVYLESNVLLYYFSSLHLMFMQIIQLEKRLRDQFAERRVLEKALGYESSSHDTSNETLMPKVDSSMLMRCFILALE